MSDTTGTASAARVAEHAALIAGAARMQVTIGSLEADKLLTLLDFLGDWNQRINLTAIRARAEMITKHLLDSLSVQPFLAGPRIIDVGTGAGFPGLPLAIVNPGMRFVLIDGTAKKLAFVSHAADALNLANVEVVHVRAEDYRPPVRADQVISRALGSLAEFTTRAGHLASPSGELLAMKGKLPHEEIAALKSPWQVAATPRLHVAGLDQERHLVRLTRRA